MEGKSSTQRERFFKSICQLKISECPGDSGSEKFSSPNQREVDLECDWNIKISQKRSKFGFAEKKTMGFLRKKHEFFKIGWGGNFYVECISNEIFTSKWWFFPPELRVFYRNQRKKINLGKLSEIYEKSILRKNAFIFSKSIISKIKGLKICRWWPAVLFHLNSKPKVKSAKID